VIPVLVIAALAIWYFNRTPTVTAPALPAELAPAPASTVALLGLPMPAPTPAPAQVATTPLLARKLGNNLKRPEENFWTIDAGDDSTITLKDPPVASVGFNPGGTFGGNFGGFSGKGGSGGHGRGVNPN
jgi:hypothetical protein